MLRVTGIQTVAPSPPPIYQSSTNPTISYELKPNSEEYAFRSTITTNSLGFRSEELDERPLVAVVGDSITFGYGVQNNETLAAQLEQEFPRYQFLNAGVPGYNLKQQVATYNEKIRPLAPEHLLLVFYWNDIDAGPPAWLDEQGILRSHDWQPGDQRACSPIDRGIMAYIPFNCWLDTNTAFYKAFKKLVNMRYSNDILEQTQQQAQAGEVQDPKTTEQIEAYLAELRPFADSLTIPKTFIIWPDRYVHTDTKPQLVDGAEAAGFKVIDLTKLFGNAPPTLGWDTVHPSAAGISEAAIFISNQLQLP